MVLLFIAISGFVMAIAYGKKESDGTWEARVSFARAFYIRRMARILPTYYLAALAGYLVLPSHKKVCASRRQYCLLPACR